MTPPDPNPDHRISLAAIAAAPASIDPVFLDSAQYEVEPLSAALGCRLLVKLETANPIRSFKGRGGSLLVAGLDASPAHRAGPLVSASAGNWGQALAYACRARVRPLLLFAATTASALKVERMRALGAEVRLAGQDFDAAKAAGEAYAASRDLRFAVDSLDVETSIGAGTIAAELLAADGAIDAVLLPLGNGALLTGMGRWIKAASPATEVIGVVAAGADAMAASWAAGRVVVRDVVDTIADGIAVRVPVPEALADMRGTVDDVVLVDDAAIVAAMRLLFDVAGLIVEPAGAVGVAALLADPGRYAGRRVATVLCGGNITAEQARRWLM